MTTREKNSAKGKAAHRFESFQFWKELLGISFLFLGLFLILSVISYHHEDPSLLSQTKQLPKNFGGRVGANLAEILIQGLGIAAYLLTTLVTVGGYFLVSRRKIKFSAIHAVELGSQVFLVVMSAALFALVFGAITLGGGSVSAGGLVGQTIAKSLIHLFNFWGTLLALSFACCVAFLFSTPFSASSILEYVFEKLGIAIPHVLRGIVQTSADSSKRAMTVLEKHRTEMLLKKGLLKNEPEIAPAPAKKTITTSKTGLMTSIAEVANAGLSLLDDSESALEVIPPTTIDPVPTSKKAKTSKSVGVGGVGLLSQGNYRLPTLDFLNEHTRSHAELDRNRLIENSKLLETKLTDFGIEGQVVAVRPGPVITMYEFKPGPGVKISQIAALADDLSLALSAQSVRIVAPIPGKNVVGIEIPNDERERVFLREILETEAFQTSHVSIPVAVGKEISGAPVVTDLARMPHLLVAGAPGAGKSVFINSLICSLLYKFNPKDMRLIMVDPKQLELNLYENIPHLLLPVVDDPKKASTALKWAVNEMERRYKIMAKSGIRNVQGFNQKLEKDGEEKMRKHLCPKDDAGMPDPTSLSHLFEHDERGEPRIEHMPFILVIIDEFADLMMVAPKDIETSVARLAQKARAAGIHLVIATQRPSVDVVTGLIKANLPSRISFQVASKVDSRTILDSIGAEKLLGQGDMLFIPPGLARLTRIHGAFVNEEEINKICDHWRSQGAPVYREEILVDNEEVSVDEADGAGDELYQQAITIVREMGQASASMLQRRLKVGYNRAARMVEAMEVQGIVGPQDGARPREVLY